MSEPSDQDKKKSAFKEKLQKFKKGLAQELRETKALWRTIQKTVKGEAVSEREKRAAKKQIFDVFKTAFVVALQPVPIPGLTLIVMAGVKVLNKIFGTKWSVMPSALRTASLEGLTPEQTAEIVAELFQKEFSELLHQQQAMDRVAARYTKKAMNQETSIALMQFLSAVARRLQVGEHIYVVGGAVRNFVLGAPVKDVDVVIDSVALHGKDSEWFAKKVAEAIPAPTNLTTNQYGVAILTVTGDWMVGGMNLKGEVIEIANTRKESYGGAGGKGYKPHTIEPATIKEDVLRREFTFNCMAGDTLIPTEKGILRIDEINNAEDCEQHSIHLMVAGQDGPAMAVGWQYSGFAPTLRVTTEWGHSFSCTYNHPVLVLRGHDHVWVLAEHLEEGDLLCVPVRQITRHQPLVLDLPEPTQPTRGVLKEVRKPEVMTPELAFVIGCIVSEGSNTPKRISFSNSDPAFISRYVECFQTAFGFTPSRNKVVEKGSVRILNGVVFTANVDGYDIYADSKTVVGWLEYLGLYSRGAQKGVSASHHKVVPWSILQADERSQWAFLAAYLEGDGSIRPDTGRITFCSVSPHIRQQLQILLGAHGILSKVKDRFVYINAVDSALLWGKIQPWMVTKRFDYTARDTRARNRYGIPKEYLQGVVRGRRVRVGNNQGPSVYRTDAGEEVSLGGFLEALRLPKRLLHDAYARGDLAEFMSGFKTISPEEHTKLQRLFDLGYQYVAVTAIEDAGGQDVYDISMGEGIEPAFVANGVVVHNTMLWRLLDLAHGPDKAEIIDLTGCGLQDLRERRMRCPRDPDIVFSDDPTRLLRAVKFLNKYDLQPTPDTEASIKRNAHKLKSAPYNAIADLLIRTLLVEPTAKKALIEMKRLGLLDVVAEMVEENKAFKATLANWAGDQRLRLLFELLDLGFPVAARFTFLSPVQQARVKELSFSLPETEVEHLLELLKQPGKGLDIPTLVTEFGLAGKQIGQLTDLSRELLLAYPELARSRDRLTNAVRHRLSGSRVASVHLWRLGEK